MNNRKLVLNLFLIIWLGAFVANVLIVHFDLSRTGTGFVLFDGNLRTMADQFLWLDFIFPNNLGAYVIGILMACIFGAKLKVRNSWLNFTIFNFANLLCIALWFAVAMFEDSLQFQVQLFGKLICLNLKALAAPISKLFGALAIAITNYMFWNGSLPVISSFLSNSLFQKLGKFSYSTFLMHYIIIWYQNSRARYPRDLNHLGLFNETISLLVMAHLLGYLLFIIVEATVIRLVRRWESR